MSELSYERSEEIALHLVNSLTEIYFKGVDRNKVSAIDMLHSCPSFINDCWGLIVNKTLKEIENESGRSKDTGKENIG